MSKNQKLEVTSLQDGIDLFLPPPPSTAINLRNSARGLLWHTGLKDLILLLQWLRFIPWLGNFHMPWGWPKLFFNERMQKAKKESSERWQ